MIITQVRNPKWGKAISPAMEEVNIVKCEVQTDAHGDEWLPFACTPYDTEKHGKKLWEDFK